MKTKLYGKNWRLLYPDVTRIFGRLKQKLASVRGTNSLFHSLPLLSHKEIHIWKIVRRWKWMNIDQDEVDDGMKKMTLNEVLLILNSQAQVIVHRNLKHQSKLDNSHSKDKRVQTGY